MLLECIAKVLKIGLEVQLIIYDQISRNKNMVEKLGTFIVNSGKLDLPARPMRTKEISSWHGKIAFLYSATLCVCSKC